MKSQKLWIFLGAVIVFAAAGLGALPYNLLVDVPGNILLWITPGSILFVSEQVFAYKMSDNVLLVLSMLTFVIFYLLACLFIKPPYKIRLPVTLFAALFLGLSTLLYIYAYASSARSNVDLYLFNFGMIAGILLVFIYNRIRPSFYSALLFTLLFFVWLAYVSFPLIGPAQPSL